MLCTERRNVSGLSGSTTLFGGYKFEETMLQHQLKPPWNSLGLQTKNKWSPKPDHVR